MTTKKVEINCTTGEIIEREMTLGEVKAEKALQEAILKEQEEKNLLLTPEAEAKAAQRQALLERLGITQEEAQLLLGGN